MGQKEVPLELLEPGEIPEGVTSLLGSGSGTVAGYEGRLYAAFHGKVLSCPEGEEGRVLLETLLRESAVSGVMTGPEPAWRELLLGLTTVAAKTLVKDFGVRDADERCVLLFQKQGTGKPLRNVGLKELMLIETGETLLFPEDNVCVLIKRTCETAPEDVEEYARAVVEMAEGEAGVSLEAGIGQPAGNLIALRRSYEEAASAIRTGRLFRLPAPVYAYRLQGLERLLEEVPPSRRLAWRRQMLGERAQKLLTGEMLETVQAFFQNDLNLSTTARQLFLHRNTLTYRLDRIHRETGLDVRSFSDAVIWKLLMEIPEADQSREASGGTERMDTL